MTGRRLVAEVVATPQRGVVRVSRSELAAFGLRPGDTLRATGGRSTHGRVSVGAVADGCARIDAVLASNCGAKPGTSLLFVPTALPAIETATLRIEGTGQAAPDELTEALFDMALTDGDQLGVTLAAGRHLRLEVLSVIPGGAGLLGPDTLVTLQSQPQDEAALDGIGGMESQIRRVQEMIVTPLLRPELFDRLGISAPRGVLFSGPPGSGKTLLARAVAARTKASFFHINGPEIVSKHYGDSEAALRRLFETAEKQAPSIVFIDEIDAIAPRRDDLSGDKQVERRVVAQLLTLMDGLSDRGRIVVMAATNLPDALDPALRRPGRFDREIRFDPPDASQRRDILAVHLARAPLAADLDLTRVAEAAHGYVGADLAALAREAGMAALARAVAAAGSEAAVDVDELTIGQPDLDHGLAVTSPSALRDAAVESAPVRWDDIGGLDATKAELHRAVIWPIQHRDRFRVLGVRPPRGVLLAGPPGSGKTLLARALATESGLNFVPVRSPRLILQHLGEAERAVARLFETARASAPTLLFFDELDALAPRRSASDPVLARVVAQLLVEIDGAAGTDGVVLLAATNRATDIDPALVRPGRFDTVIPLELPDLAARRAILSVHLGNRPLAPGFDLETLALRTDGSSGADLAALVAETARIALVRILDADLAAESGLSMDDAETALVRLRRSDAARASNFISAEGAKR